jgi:uncharacterized membrane-anchored protein
MPLLFAPAHYAAGPPKASAAPAAHSHTFKNGKTYMSLGTILLIVVILMLVGALPTWPHARSLGYGPSGLLGAILVIVLVLFLMGRL